MIDNLRGRLSKRDVGVVAEGHYTSIGDLLGEEIFQPERLRLRVCPGGKGIAAEAVDGHDTNSKAAVSKTRPKNRRPQLADLQEGLTRWWAM
jgi:hypothetical protein